MATIGTVERAGFEASTDEEIVNRVKAGDTALYEIIMRRYNRRLYRAARAILRDDAEAEEGDGGGVAAVGAPRSTPDYASLEVMDRDSRKMRGGYRILLRFASEDTPGSWDSFTQQVVDCRHKSFHKSIPIAGPPSWVGQMDKWTLPTRA
jgi:hypothetical protein